jgi:hypothetical protein
MAKVVVFGVAGDDGLWVADLDAGTIAPLRSPTTGHLKIAADLRAGGASVIKGVDLAIVVQSAAAVAAGHLVG